MIIFCFEHNCLRFKPISLIPGGRPKTAAEALPVVLVGPCRGLSPAGQGRGLAYATAGGPSHIKSTIRPRRIASVGASLR